MSKKIMKAIFTITICLGLPVTQAQAWWWDGGLRTGDSAEKNRLLFERMEREKIKRWAQGCNAHPTNSILVEFYKIISTIKKNSTNKKHILTVDFLAGPTGKETQCDYLLVVAAGHLMLAMHDLAREFRIDISNSPNIDEAIKTETEPYRLNQLRILAAMDTSVVHLKDFLDSEGPGGHYFRQLLVRTGCNSDTDSCSFTTDYQHFEKTFHDMIDSLVSCRSQPGGSDESISTVTLDRGDVGSASLSVENAEPENYYHVENWEQLPKEIRDLVIPRPNPYAPTDQRYSDWRLLEQKRRKEEEKLVVELKDKTLQEIERELQSSRLMQSPASTWKGLSKDQQRGAITSSFKNVKLTNSECRLMHQCMEEELDPEINRCKILFDSVGGVLDKCARPIHHARQLPEKVINSIKFNRLENAFSSDGLTWFSSNGLTRKEIKKEMEIPERCGNELKRSGPFVDNLDGTITDSATGLQWKRCAEGQSMIDNRCEGIGSSYNWDEVLELYGVKDPEQQPDWRLATRAELETLVEQPCTDPKIYWEAFPNTPPYFFWSFDSDTDNIGSRINFSASSHELLERDIKNEALLRGFIRLVKDQKDL